MIGIFVSDILKFVAGAWHSHVPAPATPVRRGLRGSWFVSSQENPWVKRSVSSFDIHMSVHHEHNSKLQTTRCNVS